MSTSQPPVGRPGKIMSSRLMTMKFMQRAAASSPTSLSQTPDVPSPKRQKTSAGTLSAPTPPSELQLIRAALEEEENKRSRAVERQGEEAGETKWMLSFVGGGGGYEEGRAKEGLSVVTTGYSEIDNGLGRYGYGQEARKPHDVGRRSFGKFNRDLEKRQNGTADTSSSSSEEAPEANSEEDDEDSDDPAGMKDLIRASKEEAIQRVKADRKAQRRSDKAEATRLAERRKSKEVKLNKLSSISGGGGGGGKGGGKGGAASVEVECYRCGEKGHMRNECPSGGKGSADIECYNCGQKGHRKNECPQRSSGKKRSNPQ